MELRKRNLTFIFLDVMLSRWITVISSAIASLAAATISRISSRAGSISSTTLTLERSLGTLNSPTTSARRTCTRPASRSISSTASAMSSDSDSPAQQLNSIIRVSARRSGSALPINSISLRLNGSACSRSTSDPTLLILSSGLAFRMPSPKASAQTPRTTVKISFTVLGARPCLSSCA
ncbi:hypothetical protein D3C84_831660 [compost metagenome]